MSTTNIQSEQLSLNGLFEKYHIIRIPIIQRDYAQGRVQETQVRKSFLDQLKSVLSDTSAHLDLDFVYGDELSNDEHKGKCFIPLDGQQRLTTLFLLHYYLSRRDEASRSDFRNRFGKQKQDTQLVESRFRYETRFSSTAFLNALFQHEFMLDDLVTVGTRLGATPITDVNVLSQTMMNFGWFVDSWTRDPTVDSMLRMLDAIHVCFKDISGDLYGRLISEKDPAITFHLLPMQGNGLDEDLYIKMNARGLPLTAFEKIKARIIQRLGDVTEMRPLSRTQSEKEKNVPLKAYFSFMADTRWAQFFWPYHDEKKVELTIGAAKVSHTIKEIDSRILNFIAAVTINYQAVKWGSDKLNLKLMDNPSSMNWNSLEKMDDDFFIHLTDAFDAFLPFNSDSGIKPHSTLYIDIADLFKKFVTGTMSDRQYGERIQFYAFYRFGILHKKEDVHPDEFFNCCRVVRNLVQNTRFDSEEDFCKAIRSIDVLLNQSRSTGILNYLAGNENLPDAGLDRRQLKEERIKAQLLLRGWQAEIFNAEANPYLEGQIISILNLSGIEALYDENSNTLEDIPNAIKSKFTRFTNLFSKIFVKDGLAEDLDKDQLFRRALLACGDYTLTGYSNQSFIQNLHRDVGWKRYLRWTADGKRETEDKLEPLRKLLDCDFINLKARLRQCIENRPAKDLDDWIGMLVQYPEIWAIAHWNEHSSGKFIRFMGDPLRIYLLCLRKLSGKHYELRSLYKYCLLKETLDIPSNFKIEACVVSGDECEPYFRLYNDALQYCVYYSYDKERPWRIELWCLDDKTVLTPEMVKWAEDHKFERQGDGPQLYMERLVSDGELKDLLQEWINAAPVE